MHVPPEVVVSLELNALRHHASSRIRAGWVPATERSSLRLDEVATPPAGGKTYEYILWPYDRQESKGKMKSVTIRLAGDKVLVLGYRLVAIYETNDRDQAFKSPIHSFNAHVGTVLPSGTVFIDYYYLKHVFFLC